MSKLKVQMNVKGPVGIDDLFQFDEFLKRRHTRESGYPENTVHLKRLDSRFHGNDRGVLLRTPGKMIKHLLKFDPLEFICDLDFVI